jgi:type II secretory pathway component GspD/PulD (secretin)
MTRLRFGRRAARGLLAFGAILALMLGAAAAQDSGAKKEPDKKEPDKKAGADKNGEPQKKVEPKAKEKLYSLEFRQKPWQNVFEWLSDKSGLPFISKYQPTGTFNFIAPTGHKYTMAQVIDIINEGLLESKYVLLRRSNSLTLVPADEKIDGVLVPLVSMEELAERGDTEVVKVVLQLHKLLAEEQAPEAKKMMSPYGEVVPLITANQVVLTDNAKTLRQVIKITQKNDETDANESFTYKCKSIRAKEVEPSLARLLGAATTEATPAAAPGRPPFGPGAFPMGQPPAPLPPASKRNKTVVVTSDENTNTLLISGPPDKIAMAKTFLAKLDTGDPVYIGPPSWNTYELPQGNAEAMVKILSENYKQKPSVRIYAMGTDRMMAYGMPEDHGEIAKIIGLDKPPPQETQKYSAGSLDADKLALWLNAMFGDSKGGAPYITSNPLENGVIVRGSKQQVAEVKKAISSLAGDAGAQSGNLRIINLGEGSAATLAEALGRLIPQMRDNPVKVVPLGPPELVKPENPPLPMKNAVPPQKPPEPPLKESASPMLSSGQVFVAQDLDDPREKKAKPDEKDKDKDKDKKKGPPITIMAVGNKLVVSSEDPKALDLVQQLVYLMTRTDAGPDFTVFRLRFANASDTAKLLDDLFNTPKQPQQGQQRGPGGGGQGPGGQPGGFGPGGGGFGPGGGGGGFANLMQQMLANNQQSSQKDRVRVVADVATNSLLVRANALDLLTIERLLKNSIDVQYTDSAAITKTFMIGPLKYASSTDVKRIIEDVYRNSMNGGATTTTFGGGFGGGGG